LIENTFDQKRIYANLSSYPNPNSNSNSNPNTNPNAQMFSDWRNDVIFRSRVRSSAIKIYCIGGAVAGASPTLKGAECKRLQKSNCPAVHAGWINKPRGSYTFRFFYRNWTFCSNFWQK